MLTAIVFILVLGTFAAVGVRVYEERKALIRLLDDEDPFTDNDPRLDGVRAPEDEE